jgi:tetratricopeptide (TPR) repeat protein
VTTFIEEFRRELEALPRGEVGAAVELLMATLDPLTARVFQLSAIPHQFTRELLAVLTPSLTQFEIVETERKLLALSVILPGDREFAVHDDVRDYLFRQWLSADRAEEFASVNSRLVGHFKKLLEDPAQCSQLLQHRIMFHGIGADPASGFGRFLELLAQARRKYRIDDCERLIALVQEYDGWLSPSQTAYLTYQTGKLNADRRRWTVARELFARVAHDSNTPRELQVKALTRLGTAHARQAEWEGAIRSFQEALALASADETSRKSRSWILHEWGVTLRDKGDTDGAEALLLERVAIAEAGGNWMGVAAGSNSLGSLYRKRGDHQAAIKVYEVALNHLLEHEETFRSAQVYNNLGRSLGDVGDWESSERHLQQSLKIKREACDTHGQAISLSNLIRTYWNLGKRKEAAEAAQTAVELFLQINEIPRAAMVKRDAARLAHRDHRKTAEHAYRQAIELFRRAGLEEEAKAVEGELSGLHTEAASAILKVRSAWELVRKAINLTSQHFTAIVLPYTVLVAPFAALQLWAAANDKELITLVGLLLSLLVGSIAYGVVAVSISEAFLGNKPSLMRSFRYVFRHNLIGTLLIATLAQGALVVVGLLLLIIPGLLLIVWLAFTPMVMVLERKSTLRALRRSKSLGSGYHLRTAGLLFGFLGVLVLGDVLLGLLLERMFDSPLAAPVGQVLWQICLTPVIVSSLVLMYYDLRGRKEAYDVAGLAEDLIL